MHDSELKKLLLESHPIRPGQEERAWSQLKERLAQPRQSKSDSILAGWPWALTGCALILIACLAGNSSFRSLSFASAASQSPGIYATAFYSHTAQAQVVWLNGMGPASDKPTYLDPTTVIPAQSDSHQSLPTDDPNSL